MPLNQDSYRPITSHLNHRVRKQLNISWSEYILLDTVYHLSAKDGYCYASTTHLADVVGITFNGFKRLRDRLVQRELLVEYKHGLQTGQSFNEIAFLEKDVETTETAQSSKTAQSAINRGGLLNKVHKSEQSTDNKYSNNKTTNKPKTCSTAEAKQIVDYYNDVFNSTIQHLPTRLDKIKARSRVFKLRDIATAIKYANHDDFFMGAKGWRGDLDYLIRSDENIEKYLTKAPAAKKRDFA